MAKFTKNIRKPWTYGDLCKLKKLAWKKTPTHLIAQKLGKDSWIAKFPGYHKNIARNI